MSLVTESDIRRRIILWECLRLPFNGFCAAGAWVAWSLYAAVTSGVDELPPATLSDPGAIRYFAYAFGLLNLAYFLVYAAEFLGRAISPGTARFFAIIVYVTGCGFGFILGLKASASIAGYIVSEKRSTLAYASYRKYLELRFEAEEKALNEARQRAANKASSPPAPTH